MEVRRWWQHKPLRSSELHSSFTFFISLHSFCQHYFRLWCTQLCLINGLLWFYLQVRLYQARWWRNSWSVNPLIDEIVMLLMNPDTFWSPTNCFIVNFLWLLIFSILSKLSFIGFICLRFFSFIEASLYRFVWCPKPCNSSPLFCKSKTSVLCEY